MGHPKKTKKATDNQVTQKEIDDLFRDMFLADESQFDAVYALHPEMKSPAILKAMLRFCEEYDAPESIWCSWYKFLKVKAGATGSKK